MKNYALAWVGNTDIKMIGDLKSEGGPIAAFINSDFFNDIDIIYILVSYKKLPEDVKKALTKKNISSNKEIMEYYKAGLKKRNIFTKVELSSSILTNPTNHTDIYKATVKKIKEIEKKQKDKIHWHFHLSPGTPSMHAILLMLGKSQFPAELYHSWFDFESKETHLGKVDVQFDIALELLPTLKLKASKKIMNIWDNIPEFTNIIFKSPEMQNVMEGLHTIGQTDVPVLITGETGTGKELAAKAIHSASLRKDKNFIPVNCGAIPEELIESELFGHVAGAFTGASQNKKGLVEIADRGTLFLDEFGELTAKAQVKLLRLLQEGKYRQVGGHIEKSVDIRVVAATNKDLVSMMSNGTFREDLFYRINVGFVQLPPLRSRKEDIELLSNHFLNEVNSKFHETANITGYKKKKLNKKALKILTEHNWPGNIRELYNTIQRACLWSKSTVISEDNIKNVLITRKVVTCEDSKTKDLSSGPVDLDQEVIDLKKKYIEQALKITDHHYGKAAKLLKIKNYQTIVNFMKKHCSK